MRKFGGVAAVIFEQLFLRPNAHHRLVRENGKVGTGGFTRPTVCSATRGVGQASRAHIFAESAAQNPYIFRIAGLRVYRPAGTAGVNLNKVRQ